MSPAYRRNKDYSIHLQLNKSSRRVYYHLRQQELQRHIQFRNEYEANSKKHIMSGTNDSVNFQSYLSNILLH